MESLQGLKHPTDVELASFQDPALAPDKLAQLAAHLDACPTCEARLEKIEPTYSRCRDCYQALHAYVSRPDLKKDTWTQELWMKMEYSEPKRRPAFRIAWLGGAIAAAIIVGLLILPWGRGSELRAETLLARAASAQTIRSSQLRIRTRTASLVPKDAIRERFSAAHYNWQDPLNPRSYSDWRQTLKNKASKVIETRNDQTIETTTMDGTLRDAALTLDANLAPVRGTFRFADEEWVEITVAPDSTPAVITAPALITASVPATTATAPRESPAERELNIRVAMDALNLGANDPIEINIQHDGDIQVIAYRLAPELEKQLRASLEHIPGVTFSAKEPQPSLPDPSNTADAILRTSQDVSYEAHYVADLQTRFTQATLSPSSKIKLEELRARHSMACAQHAAELRRELEADHIGFHPIDPASLNGQSMAESATAIDSLITELYVKKAAPETWRELEKEFGKLEALLGAQ